MDSDLCTEALVGEADRCVVPPRLFRESFRVVVEEDDESACEGAGGCCDDRAREDLRGDIARRKSSNGRKCDASLCMVDCLFKMR